MIDGVCYFSRFVLASSPGYVAEIGVLGMSVEHLYLDYNSVVLDSRSSDNLFPIIRFSPPYSKSIFLCPAFFMIFLFSLYLCCGCIYLAIGIDIEITEFDV